MRPALTRQIENKTNTIMDALYTIDEPVLQEVVLELPKGIKECRRELDHDLSTHEGDELLLRVGLLDKQVTSLQKAQKGIRQDRINRLLKNLEKFLKKYEHFRQPLQ